MEKDMQFGNKMTTLSEVINILRVKGFNEDFEITEKGFIAQESGKTYRPDNLTIKRTYRFEGESDPDDMSILYAIETDKGEKGIFIDAYGTYANNECENIAEFLKKVKIKETTI